MFRRYLKQLFTTLFNRQTEEIRSKEEEIEKDIAEMEKMNSKNNHKPVNSRKKM